MTQKQLAKRLKCSEPWVSAWVTGRSRIPGIHALTLSEITGKKIGEILDMPGSKLRKLIKSIREE